MNDLYINISYMTAAEVKRIGSELRSDPSDTQPGFYIRACNRYTDIVKYTRIPLDRVVLLSRAFDKAFDGWNTRVVGGRIGGAMRVAVDKHRADSVRRREAAEAALKAAQDTLAAIDAEEA